MFRHVIMFYDRGEMTDNMKTTIRGNLEVGVSDYPAMSTNINRNKKIS